MLTAWIVVVYPIRADFIRYRRLGGFTLSSIDIIAAWNSVGLNQPWLEPDSGGR